MAKVNPLLDKYEYMIFDMDGVITSEQNYWDIAALTVYELLNSDLYYGREQIVPSLLLSEVKKVRSLVFYEDRLITLLKERGVNSNWDLAFSVFAYMLSGSFSSFADIFSHIASSENLLAFDIYEECAALLSSRLHLSYGKCERGGEIWARCRDTFQEWYLGSDGFEKVCGTKPAVPGKMSMENREVPVIEVPKIVKTLSSLRSSGKKLLVATGRSSREIKLPMRLWDIERYFDPNGLATYTYIEECEDKMAQRGISVCLTKPEPYIFLKALFGTDYPDEKLLSGDFDKTLLEKALVIGDAGCDILAAKKMGCDFLAVLTGVSGEKAKGYFKEQNAEFIFPSIFDMITKE